MYDIHAYYYSTKLSSSDSGLRSGCVISKASLSDFRCITICLRATVSTITKPPQGHNLLLLTKAIYCKAGPVSDDTLLSISVSLKYDKSCPILEYTHYLILRQI